MVDVLTALQGTSNTGSAGDTARPWPLSCYEKQDIGPDDVTLRRSHREQFLGTSIRSGLMKKEVALLSSLTMGIL